jgi:exodeoxyribonuclease-1
VNSYLFYDIETTGLNRAFDQVLQFASIRTDLTLNELERHDMRVSLRDDVVPSPQSLLTHGISISEMKEGVSEYEAMCQIHRMFNRPGTISLGYNSLGFDDEVLRFGFYRNLLPPYTHQYANGCGRMDLFPVTILYWLYKPEVAEWPEIDGIASLKLEKINERNQLAPGKAHDAMVDVSASLALARRLQAETQMWNYVCGFFDKQTDTERARQLPVSMQSAHGPHQTALMVASEFGTENQFQAPVVHIGGSTPYKNQTLWLRLDQPDIVETTADAFDATTWVVRKRFGDVGILLPPLERFWQRLAPERRELAEQHQRWLAEQPELLREIIHYHREFRYPDVPDLDVDAALYELGFPSNRDQGLCRKFHTADIEEKIRILDLFENKCYRQLAIRLLARNQADNVPRKIRTEFKHYLKRVNPPTATQAPVDYRSQPRLTPTAALTEIEALLKQKTHDEAQANLLRELKDYLRRNFNV